jgi:Concanavalin A-like lectin/glucanases superfamily
MTLSSRLFLALSVAPFLVAQTKYQTDLIAMSPLGFWPLNNNSNDLSGHGNPGTPSSSMAFSTNLTSPVEPNFLPFNGVSEVFAVPANASFNLSALQPMTLTAWIKTDAQGLGSMFILGKADPKAVTGFALVVDNGDLGAPMNSGRLAFTLIASGTTLLTVESTNAVNDGRWRMVTATYDGSGSASGVHLYIDGNNTATTTLVNAVGSGSILNTSPLTVGNVSDLGNPFEGSLSGPALFGFALTPAQVLQLAADASASRAVLGQFAFGGGWYSAVYFSNASLNQVSFTVNFLGDDGNPLTVPSISSSSKTLTLPAGGSAVIEAPNAGTTVIQGYVSVVLPVGVTGYGVFRQSITGIADQEAVAPLTYPGVTNQTLIYDETSFVTGVAIVNPSNVVTTVAVTAEDINGNVIGTSSLVLQPSTKTVAALRNISGLSPVVGNRGNVKFSVTSGSVLVLGLRFNGSAFTSIPAVSQRQLFDFSGEPLF